MANGEKSFSPFQSGSCKKYTFWKWLRTSFVMATIAQYAFFRPKPTASEIRRAQGLTQLPSGILQAYSASRPQMRSRVQAQITCIERPFPVPKVRVGESSVEQRCCVPSRTLLHRLMRGTMEELNSEEPSPCVCVSVRHSETTILKR